MDSRTKKIDLPEIKRAVADGHRSLYFWDDLETNVALYPPLDHRQAVTPELRLVNVNAKARRQLGRRRLARAGQQGFVVGDEGRAARQIQGIQPSAEQQPKSIRVVVEGQLGAIIM